MSVRISVGACVQATGLAARVPVRCGRAHARSYTNGHAIVDDQVEAAE